MKPFWEITAAEVQKCLQATTWYPAITEYFRGGGFSSTFLTRGGMPVTMSRINLVKGLGPVLQLAEGWTVDLPDEVHQTLNERTNPTWPTHWFAPRLTGQGAFRDVYSVMANWGANHGALSYGHIGADLITLASMLRIPVCMHNLEEAALFRPSAWSAFGTVDPTGADYRACARLRTAVWLNQGASMTSPSFLAIDLGAESGRGILGKIEMRLTLEEVHRFLNGPVRIGDHIHWDILRLWSEVQACLRLAAALPGASLTSVGLDAWGVDFSLLDVSDRLIGNPYHYRDSRTNGMIEAVCRIVPREKDLLSDRYPVHAAEHFVPAICYASAE